MAEGSTESFPTRFIRYTFHRPSSFLQINYMTAERFFTAAAAHLSLAPASLRGSRSRVKPEHVILGVGCVSFAFAFRQTCVLAQPQVRRLHLLPGQCPAQPIYLS